MTDTHTEFGHGPWKEGRAKAISLCYVDLTPAQCGIVATNHARVGIRGTLALRDAREGLRPLVERNWDLAVMDTLPPYVTAELAELDGRHKRGVLLLSGQLAGVRTAEYRIRTAPGTIAAKGSNLDEELPSLVALADAVKLRGQMECAGVDGQWSIWRIDSHVLDAMGDADHASLLTWLGEHHSRIWCAPVRDIAQFRAAISDRQLETPRAT